MRMIAIVPVRGGSTRFPGKNFAPFQDTNLLAHAVVKLLPICDEVMISSDVPGEVFRALEALRPEHRQRVTVAGRDVMLARAETRTEAVVADLLEQRVDIQPHDTIVLSQVTSPVWRPESLVRALDRFIMDPSASLVAVTPDLRPCGAFYVFTKEAFMEHGGVYSREMRVFEISFAEGIDIDYPYQICVAEAVANGKVVE